MDLFIGLVALFFFFLLLLFFFTYYFNNFFIHYFRNFFSFLFSSIFFWAMWLTGSWCSGLVQAWTSEVGEPSSGHWTTGDLPAQHNISRRELSQRSLSQRQNPAPPNGQQAVVLDAQCQTTSKTGTQPHPLAEKLPKIILSSQTPQNTPPDAALPTRKTRSSPTQQNTGTSPLHQEAYTSHWTNLTHWGQTPKTTGTMNLQPVKRRPQTR